MVDRDHAAIVEYIVGRLRLWGWEVRLEYGFNHYGDRGSVDILAWHPGERVLLIIEVKSRLTDLQDMLNSLGRKMRVVPPIVARDGRAPVATGCLLAILGTTANRRVVAQHPQTFSATFPDRGADVIRRLRRPTDPLRGLWFVAPRTIVGVRRQRVRPQAEPLPPAE